MWVNGSLLTSAPLRRRITGWISSRVIRAVIAVFPQTRDADQAMMLGGIVKTCLTNGCPCISVFSSASDAHTLRLKDCIESQSDGRHITDAPCQHDLSGPHCDYYLIGSNIGFPPIDAARCDHHVSDLRDNQKRTLYVRLGLRFASRIARWINTGVERLKMSNLGNAFLS